MHSNEFKWPGLILSAFVFVSCASAPQNVSTPKEETQDNIELPNDEFSDNNVEVERKVIKQAPDTDLSKKFSESKKAKQYRMANEVAAEILARNPNDPKTLNGLTAMAIDQGKLELARMLISKILSKNPTSAAAYNNLGVVELKSDNLRLALVNFKRATELDSSNRSAHANLGAIYLQYRNYTNAAEEFKKAVESGDKSPETYSNLGFALRGIGKISDAENAYEKAVAQGGNNIPILFNYAVLLVDYKKDYGKAIKLLNKVRFIAREPAILEKANALARKAENKEKQ